MLIQGPGKKNLLLRSLLCIATLTLVAEDKFSPFEIINCCPMRPQYGRVQPVIILRILDFPSCGVNPRDVKALFEYHNSRVKYHYPGGSNDEMASLLSLALGIRLKSGKEHRFFQPSSRYGMQFFPEYKPSFVFSAGERPRLPWATGHVSINSAESLIAAFFRSSPHQALALLRAARLYADALWVAESQPELSWLFLVSAIEVAANHNSNQYNPIELLKSEKPQWYEVAKNVTDVLRDIAKHYATLSRATRKFKNFLLRYKPDPPSKRPHDTVQLTWDDENLEKNFGQIYIHRSKTLHAGVPFPGYMCTPTFQHEKWDAPAEFWSSSMTLHIFEYIVRGSLLKWWTEIATGCSAGRDAEGK
jgi:hypothetical protein